MATPIPIEDRCRNRNELTPAIFIRLYVLNLARKRLARHLNVTTKFVSKFEIIGVVPHKHRNTYQDIARAMGRFIPIEWFDKLPVPDIPGSSINDEDEKVVIEMKKGKGGGKPKPKC